MGIEQWGTTIFVWKEDREDKGNADLFLDEIAPLIIARCMARRARMAPGCVVYHTLNRANGRNELFAKAEDYAAFERIMVAAMQRSPIRLLAYCLMLIHWHMVISVRHMLRKIGRLGSWLCSD